MSSNTLMRLTDKQVCSSADASQIVFTRPFSLDRHESFDDADFASEEDYLAAPLECPSAPIDLCRHNSVREMEAELGDVEVSASLLRRLYCHWVIQQLGAHDLPEAATALTQFTDLDQTTVSEEPPVPPARWEPIIPDTDECYTVRQMAKAWKAIAQSIRQDDVPLSVDPDDYAL